MLTFIKENEKLPAELGWTKQASEITLDQISSISALVASSASLITGESTDTTTAHRRRNLHAGIF